MSAKLFRIGARVFSLLALTGIAGAVVLARPSITSPSVGTADEVTALFVEAQPGQDVGGYLQHLFMEPDGGWTFSASVNNAKVISVGATSASESWSVQLGGPGRTLISMGTYEVALESGAGVRPRLMVSGPNTYCSSGAVGRFTVHQIEMSTPTTVERLAVSFETHCYGSIAARVGELRFHSTGVDLAAVTLGAEQLMFTAGQTRAVTVANRGNVDQAILVGLGGAFPDAFEIVSDTCGVVAPGANCAVEVRFTSAGSTTRIAEIQITDQTLRGGRYATLVGQAVP